MTAPDEADEHLVASDSDNSQSRDIRNGHSSGGASQQLCGNDLDRTEAVQGASGEDKYVLVENSLHTFHNPHGYQSLQAR